MGKDVSSFRHPERSRGIFLAGRKTVHMRKSVIPSRMKYGVYRSPHIFYLTGVQGRFLASLEMTIQGKAVLSFSALEALFSPLSFIPPVPYPPLRGTFPSRGRLCPSLSVSPHILVFTLTI